MFEHVHLPTGKVLIPGLIDTCSTYIKHPEVVAQRLIRFARIAGRENVIAGTDCGFGTFFGASAVPPSVAWAKLQSLTRKGQAGFAGTLVTCLFTWKYVIL